MSPPYTVAFDSSAEPERSRLGGKCAMLATMTRAGAPVPPGFVVTTDAFELLLGHGGLRRVVDAALDRLSADPRVVAACGAELRRMVSEEPVPSSVASAVIAAYEELCGAVGCPDAAVAVRSSTEAEDCRAASFAGQHDTFLWVRGADAVLDAVRRCWASLWTDHAIVYRAAHGLAQRGLRMAVGVQQMVDALTSGAAVTVNLADGDPSKILVEAVWGLGLLMVAGQVTPDAYLVDKVLLTTVRTTVSPKEQELVPTSDGHDLVRRELEEDRQRVPCLAPPEVVEIARLAKTAERHYGCPQGIEWAIDRHRPAAAGVTAMLLQTRPEPIRNIRPGMLAPAGRGAGVSSIVDSMLGAGRLPT